VEFLFVAKGNERIDPGGAARGEAARGDADGGNQGHDRGKGHRISWRNTPKLAGDQACEGVAGKHADKNSCGDDERAFREDHFQDRGLPGTESHANADFVSLQRDRVGHHAEDSDDNEQQADAGDGSDGDKNELWAGVIGISQQGVYCYGVCERNIRVNRRDDAADAIDDDVRI